MTCPICCGARTIELPLYHPLPVVPITESAPVPVEASRQYACPECATGGPISHFHAVSRSSVIDLNVVERLDEEVYRDAVLAKEGARLLAECLVRHGLMTMQSTPNLDRQILETKFTIGVVSAQHVAFMDDRLRAHGREVADEVARRAAEKIRQVCAWGTPIDVAVDQVKLAAEEVAVS